MPYPHHTKMEHKFIGGYVAGRTLADRLLRI